MHTVQSRLAGLVLTGNTVNLNRLLLESLESLCQYALSWTAKYLLSSFLAEHFNAIPQGSAYQLILASALFQNACLKAVGSLEFNLICSFVLFCIYNPSLYCFTFRPTSVMTIHMALGHLLQLLASI